MRMKMRGYLTAAAGVLVLGLSGCEAVGDFAAEQMERTGDIYRKVFPGKIRKRRPGKRRTRKRKKRKKTAGRGTARMKIGMKAKAAMRTGRI